MPVGLRSRVPAKMTSSMRDAAQRLGRLLAQHPGDGVGDIRLAAAVGTDDGRNAVAMEPELGAVAKRLEPENLQLLQFEQLELLGPRATVFTRRIPRLLRNDARCERFPSPGLDRAGTD